MLRLLIEEHIKERLSRTGQPFTVSVMYGFSRGVATYKKKRTELSPLSYAPRPMRLLSTRSSTVSVSTSV